MNKIKEIKTRQAAIRICDIFEELLDEYDITIPSDDREGGEDEARLYGEEYLNIEESVNEILCDLVKKVKENPAAAINETEA